jgi:hypothetical protein
VGLDEPFQLDEHPSGSGGGADATFVEGKRLDEATHDAGRGAELAAAPALGAGAFPSGNL